jgi:Flp pilus assembly protein TadB
VQPKLGWFLTAAYLLLGVAWIVLGVAGPTDWIRVVIGVVWLAAGIGWWLRMSRQRRRQRATAGQEGQGPGR